MLIARGAHGYVLQRRRNRLQVRAAIWLCEWLGRLAVAKQRGWIVYWRRALAYAAGYDDIELIAKWLKKEKGVPRLLPRGTPFSKSNRRKNSPHTGIR